MDKINDGGTAFPLGAADKGMTLRQWYAGQALSGDLSFYSGENCPQYDFEVAAKRAFEYADAMIAYEQKEKEMQK